MTSPFDWRNQPSQIDWRANGNLQAVRKKLAKGIEQNRPQITFTKKGKVLNTQRAKEQA